MSVHADIAARHARILADLSEQGAALARDLQERAVEAEDNAEAAELALAFHRVSRAVRQTLALELKLFREHRGVADDLTAGEERAAVTRRFTRRIQVRAAGERLIWTEHEGDEADRLLADLNDWLDEAERAPDFADQAVEALVARLTADLGLTPPTDAGAAEAPWRSSA